MLLILLYFGVIGLVLCISLVAPIFVSLLAGEIEVAQRLGVHLLLGTFMFGSLVLAVMQRKSRLPEVGKLVLLTTIWIMLPLFAAIPIADISQLGFLDSLFEAVSGLTTAGGSILKTVESWPQGLLFWRIQLQWFGGFLALMTVLLIVAPMRIGGLTSRSSVYLGNLNRDGTQLRAFGSVSKIFIIYTAMTVLCSIILFMSGARAFYSVTLAMTAVSTGGFLPFDDALDTHVSSIGIFTMTLFLLLGATSVFWQRMLVDRSVSRLSSHRESYSVIALIAILSLIYMMIIVAISAPSANAVGKALLEGFFVATSLVATSGIETRPGTIALIPLIVVLFIILLGGSAYSTTGGLKHYRMGAMLVQSWNEIERLIYPHNVKPAKFGTQDYNIDLMKAIWSFFTVMILTIAFFSIAVAASGIPFEAALSATISAFATAGPVYETGWAAPGAEAWPAYSDFTTTGKLALILTMILGRLEVLVLLALISTKYWFNR